ncbi:MAG TPA: sigma-70 family RNA polymerase sigma factor [Xanthomonadales bacterium]|nr:sigma-70 family RNA polymerase sigma factor [Xanthomonadales bacterium]
MKQELLQLGNGAHALALQILGNPDDAADAVHDSFAVALQKPDVFDASKGPLRPWFLRVVRNRCIDLLRRRREQESGIDELTHQSADPEQALQFEQRDEDIHLAMARLGSEQRQIIVLRDFMDLSYAEIAAVLDIALGTVMSRLHRARLALRKELSQHDD